MARIEIKKSVRYSEERIKTFIQEIQRHIPNSVESIVFTFEPYSCEATIYWTREKWRSEGVTFDMQDILVASCEDEREEMDDPIESFIDAYEELLTKETLEKVKIQMWKEAKEDECVDSYKTAIFLGHLSGLDVVIKGWLKGCSNISSEYVDLSISVDSNDWLRYLYVDEFEWNLFVGCGDTKWHISADVRVGVYYIKSPTKEILYFGQGAIEGMGTALMRENEGKWRAVYLYGLPLRKLNRYARRIGQVVYVELSDDLMEEILSTSRNLHDETTNQIIIQQVEQIWHEIWNKIEESWEGELEFQIEDAQVIEILAERLRGMGKVFKQNATHMVFVFTRGGLKVLLELRTNNVRTRLKIWFKEFV